MISRHSQNVEAATPAQSWRSRRVLARPAAAFDLRARRVIGGLTTGGLKGGSSCLRSQHRCHLRIGGNAGEAVPSSARLHLAGTQLFGSRPRGRQADDNGNRRLGGRGWPEMIVPGPMRAGKGLNQIVWSMHSVFLLR